jgi:UDP-N-acetyl-D-mannosaminuronate dehydrogenase
LAKLVAGHDFAGKTVVICGVSYLAEVPDTRNSPTELLARLFLKEGAIVKVHDPFVKVWSEVPAIQVFGSLENCLQMADIIIFAVPHKEYRGLLASQIINMVGNNYCSIVDAQNILTDETAVELHNTGYKLIGVGKGHWNKEGYQL